MPVVAYIAYNMPVVAYIAYNMPVVAYIAYNMPVASTALQYARSGMYSLHNARCIYSLQYVPWHV